MSQNIEEIVAAMIRERFPDASFDAVTVENDVDSDGDPVLRITAVFDGRNAVLDGARLAGLVRHLRPKLAEMKVDSFPLVRFVSRSDASKLKREAA